MKRKKEEGKEKEPQKKQKEELKEGLPAEIVKEILISIGYMKDILSDNKRFESEFKEEFLKKLLSVGKEGGVYRENITYLIYSKYPYDAERWGVQSFSEKSSDELSTLSREATNLIFLLTGYHSVIKEQKKPILRKDIEEEISIAFHKEIMDETGVEKNKASVEAAALSYDPKEAELTGDTDPGEEE